MKISIVFAVLLLAAAPFTAHRAPQALSGTVADSARTIEALPDVRRIEAGSMRATGSFQVALDVSPDAIAHAFLVYELAGVPHWTAALRSINGLPAAGGYGAVATSGTALQIEEINPRWLRQGANELRFYPVAEGDAGPPAHVTDLRPHDVVPVVPDLALPYTVRNLRLVYLEGTADARPVLRLTYPVDGESSVDGTIVRGYVDPPMLAGSPAEIFVDDAYIPNGIDRADGSFAVFAPRTGAAGEPWDIAVEVVYPDGTRLRQSAHVGGDQAKDDDSDSDDSSHLDADGATEKSLTVGDAHLDLTRDAVAGKVKLTMRRLRHDELPALDGGMTNVTPERRGYRFGPHGLRFRKAVRLRLPYDPALIPKGLTADDVRTFFFDEAAGRWVPLPRVEAQAKLIVSATEHFTDFINATIALPEHPQGENLSPNSLQELAKGDPAAQIVQIAPPDGGATGTATLDFPIVVPPGRHGMQPSLSVQYDSSGGNGWLGVGWDLRTSSIEIKTDFGVPRYAGEEKYLLDGDELADAGSGNYVRRVEGRFDRIVRHGTAPGNYWWEVTDKNGVTSVYGQNAQARLRDPNNLTSGNIFRWYLEQESDLYGNRVDYSYFNDTGSSGEPWIQLYPQQIDYTAGPNNTPAFYHVVFTLDTAGTRSDRISSGRQGFKTYTQHRLDSIDVKAGSDLVRRYRLTYADGDFHKSLLKKIAVTGEDGTTELYAHSFDYVTMADAEGAERSAFTEEQSWSVGSGGHDFTSSTSFGGSAHGFIGLGPTDCQPHVGVGGGGGGSQSTENVMFVDVNGDGLPDRISADGTIDFNQYDPKTDAGKSFLAKTAATTDPLGHTSEWNFDVGVGAHAEMGFSASVDANWTWTHSNDDHAVVDVDGDGYPDFVSVENGFSVRRGLGESFEGTSTAWTMSSMSTSLQNAVERALLLWNLRLANPLRELVVPYDGHVTIGGAIRKKTAEGTDGIRVQIYHGASLVWSRNFQAGDTAPCTPAPLGLCGQGLGFDVQTGDRLCFLVGSNTDTTGDAVLWNPVVSYDGGDPQQREPSGAPTYVFDAGQDFRLAGFDGPGFRASTSGKIELSGALVKRETADDVVVRIAKRPTLFPDIPLDVPVWEHRFGAGEVTTFTGFPAVDVNAGDLIVFRIDSAMPIDPAAVQWTPSVHYQGSTDNAPAAVAFHVAPLRPRTPLTRWTVPDGLPELSVSCSAAAGATLYVQEVGRLVATHAADGGDFTLSLSAPAGHSVFFTLLTNAGSQSDHCSVTYATKDSSDIVTVHSVPVNVRWYRDKPEDPPILLAGGWHGWYYGEFNGAVPFSPDLLQPPPKDDDDDHPTVQFVSAVPRWEGTKNFQGPVWITGGGDLYIAAEGVNPSRRGGNVSAQLDALSGSSAGGQVTVLRKSSGQTSQVGANVGPLGLTVSSGSSDSDVDILDMNGDRYPDLVTNNGVAFNKGGAAHQFATWTPFSGLITDDTPTIRRSEDANASAAAGIGVPYTKRNGKGKASAVLNNLPTVSLGGNASVSQTRYDLIDVNGDGLPDRVSMYPGDNTVRVELNLGYRFGQPETWSLPNWTGLSDPSNHCRDAVLLGVSDLGNAGYLDNMNGLSFTVSSGTNEGAGLGPFGADHSVSISRTLVELVDINGDGLPDRVAKDSADGFFRVQINLGDRWDAETLWPVPAWRASIGDGYEPLIPGSFSCFDALTLSGQTSYSGSAGAPICIPFVVVGMQIEISAQAFGSPTGGTQLLFEDIDGDGLPDHILKKSTSSAVYVKRNKAGKVNLLSAVHRPLGSTIALAYERRGNTVKEPSSQWVLSAVSVTDPRTTTYVTTYAYDNDGVYNRTERESYGFGHVLVTLPDGSTQDRQYSNSTFYNRHLLVSEVDSSGGKTVRTYLPERSEAAVTLGTVTVANAKFLPLTAETTTHYEASGSKQEKKEYAYDAAGNVVTIADRGENLGDAADDVVTNITYKIDADHHFTHPSRVDVLNRSTIATYDANGALTKVEKTLAGGNSPDTGAPYSGSQNPAWTYSYDAYGNVESSIDPDQHELHVTYDASAHAYPVSVEDRTFSLTTTYDYDLKYGAPRKSVDENGNSLQIVYDTFGRPSSVIGPDDTADAPTLRFRYGTLSFNALPAGASAVVEHKDVTRPGAHIDSATFVDSLERTIQTKEDAELDGGSGTSTQTGSRTSGPVQFDSRSRVISEGQPVFDSSRAPSFLQSAPTTNATRFAYDALDRVTAVTFPFKRANGTNAATTLSYDLASFDGAARFLTTRTDPEGRVTRFYRDLHDNVVAVEQNGLVTRYTYDLFDQLTSVKDPKGNVTSIAYDTLGRVVTVDNPDLGKTESRYDPAGNLRAKITANLRARSQQIRYTYDHGRLSRVDYPQSPAVVYTWGDSGAPANGKNRIVAVADASGVEQRAYDKLGRLVQTVKTAAALNGNTPKGPYTTRYNYDPLGRLLSVTYPDGETLAYGFDSGGQVKSATGTLKGAAYTYLRHAGYDPFGQRVRLVLGNGAETRHTYDAASRFLAGLRTSINAYDVESFTYGYDATGTMTSLANNQKVPSPAQYGGAVTETFAYDAFVQLTHATGTYTSAPNAVSKYSLDLTYDTLGNVLSKNQLHQTGPGGKLTEKKTTYNVAYTYPAAGPQPHAATRIGDRTFHYDANGNQTAWETDGNGTRRTLAWDEENRLRSLSDNGKTTSFLYDAEGTRTNKAGQNGETIYLNPWYSLRNGEVASKHVFLDGERLATKVTPDPTPPSEKVYYYHPDHLGSANFVTDEAGTSFEHLEYFPSGELWVDEHSDTQRTPYLFSGKELDDETGLSYFGARYYDARTGQWISADPTLDGMLEVETLTGDALEHEPFFLPGRVLGYAANNPMNLTDPDGLVPYKTLRRTRAQMKKARQFASKLDVINVLPQSMKRRRWGVARYNIGDGTSYGMGAYAVSGIATKNINRRFTKAEKEGVTRLGKTYGCQSCGTKESQWPDGHFTPDHQQPLSIFKEENGTLAGYKGQLFPHCKQCSSKQGGELAKRKKANQN